MNWKLFKTNKLKTRSLLIEPDEIFLDSENLENFNSQQFEGRIEKQISKRTVIFLGIFFMISVLTFSSRLGFLQIRKGEAYLKISQNNTLAQQIIFADRGIIYDRNMVELAWNTKEGVDESAPIGSPNFSIRTYKTPGFSHTLGYVTYPTQDKSGNYWQTEFIGKDGLEKEYSSPPTILPLKLIIINRETSKLRSFMS